MKKKPHRVKPAPKKRIEFRPDQETAERWQEAAREARRPLATWIHLACEAYYQAHFDERPAKAPARRR